MSQALEQMLIQAELQGIVELGYNDAALVSSFFNGLIASGMSQDISLALTAQYLGATISARAFYGTKEG